MRDSFLLDLAQPRPDPGGGSAAAHGALVGLALLTKVITLELGRSNLDAAGEALWQEAVRRVSQLRAEVLKLREEDVKAYAVMARTLKTTHAGENRDRVVGEALAVPQALMAQAREGLYLAGLAGGACKRHLVPDVLVAVELLAGALKGAYHIARANLPLIGDAYRREDLEAEMGFSLKAGEDAIREVQTGLLERSF